MNDNLSIDIENKILSYIDRAEKREPIFLSDFYNDDKNINVIEQIIAKLKNDLVLREYSSNIYYKPLETKFGELGIDKVKLVKKLYMQNGNDIIGYVTGPSLWNHYRLTTQISNKNWIVSNNVKDNYEDKELRIKLIVPKIMITNENYKQLQILDIIEDKHKLNIEDLIYDQYYAFLNNIAQSDRKTINNLHKLSYLYEKKVQDDVSFILNNCREKYKY